MIKLCAKEFTILLRKKKLYEFSACKHASENIDYTLKLLGKKNNRKK